MRVKCIDNSIDKTNLVAGDIYDGIYVSESKRNIIVYVNENNGVTYPSNFFEVIEETKEGAGKYDNFFNKTKGIKHDNEKLKPTLLFDDMPLAIREVLRVLDYGAKKYSEGNWLKVEDGIKRYRNACDRHRLEGSIYSHDNESGLLHLAHEATNALMLLELKLRELQDK